MSLRLSRTLIALTVFTLLPNLSRGQGIPWYTVPLPIPNGFVDAATGNVHLEFRLGPAPEPSRDGELVGSKLTYDWTLRGYNYLIGTFSGPTGWNMYSANSHSGDATISVNSNGQPCPSGYPNGNVTIASNPSFIDNHGTWHASVNLNAYTKQVTCYTTSGVPYGSGSDITSFNGTATDGSGYRFQVTNYTKMQVFSPDGWLVYDNATGSPFPKDTNGNYGSQPNTSVSSTGGLCPTYPQTIPPTYTSTTTYSTSSGSQASYSINCTAQSVSEIISGTQYVGTVDFLTSIVLEDGTQYTFAYDTGTTGNHPGDLQSITLPTGGVVSFTIVPGWPNVVLSGRPASVTFGGGTWNLSYAYNSSTGVSMTTVLSPTRYDSASHNNVSDKAVFTSVPWNPYLQTAQYYNGSSTLLRTVTTAYDSNGNFLPMTITTTLNDSGQSSSVSYQYYQSLWRNYPTQKQETDFTGAIVRTTVTTYNPNFMKPTSINVYPGSNTSGTPASSTLYAYDEYSASYCKNGVQMLAGFTGAYDHDDTNFGVSNTSRGNVTTIQRLIFGTTYATTHNCYDTLGNVTQVVDANGNPTSFDYTDHWVDAYCVPRGTITHAFPTTITDALGHAAKTSYFSCGILKQSIQDPNDIAAGRYGTTYAYDEFNRPLTTNYPDNGQTTFCYSNDQNLPCYTTALPPFSTESRVMSGSSSFNNKTQLDSLGRVAETAITSDPDCLSGDKTDTTYDSFGRALTVSNPYCTAGDITYGVTTYSYDALGRTTSATLQDGSITTTSYSGNTTTLTDPAGKKRQTTSDALGRLTQVVEDPAGLGYVTTYSYDALDNLLSVVQVGSRQRNFTYDSLSRLLTANNPESGTITYVYDANGNVTTKTDARNITTTHTYDALNRLGSKTYSDGTPTAYYYYDQSSASSHSLSNYIGRLTTEGTYANSAWLGSTSFSYDTMGRIAFTYQSTQQDWALTTSSTYDLAGDLNSLTYPSGRTVTYTYNTAMHPTLVTFASINGTSVGYNYLSAATYAPTGAPATMTLGSGLTETSAYNNRLQPCTQLVASSVLTALNRTYNFYPTASGNCHPGQGPNNGNVVSIADNLQSNRTQSFSYDSLNRLSTAQSNALSGSDCWAQSFGYDSWANLLTETPTRSGCPMTGLNVGVNTKNQITNSGFSYDAAGNTLTDAVNTYAYDAESRIKTLNGTGASYTYDGDGQRVYKQAGGATTEYVYLNGQPLAERNAAGEWSDYIYAGGRRLVKADTFEDRILISGTNCSNCGWQWTRFAFANAAGLAGYVVQSGDKLFLRQFQWNGARGGMYVEFTDGTSTEWALSDQSGQVLNDLTYPGWIYRRADLTSFAGKTISNIYLIADGNTPAVSWSIFYNDIALMSTDGTVHPIYTRQKTVSLTVSGTSGVTGVSYTVNHDPGVSGASNFSDNMTNYYHGDHLGSQRLMTSVDGYPVWSAIFLPFGQEWNPQPTVNHYKFTGKERDSESNLDFFGARYDSSSMGRFMSPDPIHVMKQKIVDPQQWNLYAYVRNNPLNLIDPTGLYLVNCASDDKKCQKAADKFEKQRQRDLQSKNKQVRDAATAWGDRGEDNAINVTFKPASEVHDSQGHQANGLVQLKKDADGQVHINATFSESLGGKDLQRTIAHEGSHIEDYVRFLTSMNTSGLLPGRFNSAFDITHYQTEFVAYQTGAEVKRYANMDCGGQLCSFGPKDYATIDHFLNTNPAYAPIADQILFSITSFPQYY